MTRTSERERPTISRDRLRALIALREPLLRRRVRDLLTAEHSDFEVVAECGDGLEAAEEMTRRSPDVLLLDPALPRRDGFTLARALEPRRGAALVIIASSADSAQEAFDVGALDFLLKPVERRRFALAMERSRRWVKTRRAAALGERFSSVLHSVRAAAEYAAMIPVPSEGRVVFVPVDDVDWIEGSGNYVQLHAAGGVYRLRQTMSGIEASLDPARFRRIHRRTIVALARVRELEPLAGGAALLRLRDGTELKMSRGYRDVISWLGTEPATASAEGEATGIAAIREDGETGDGAGSQQWESVFPNRSSDY
jgi:two-component system, LytTR family, response regulator